MDLLYNEEHLLEVIDQVLAANPQAIADALVGDDKAFNALVGIVLKVIGGNVVPNRVKELIQTKLSSIADVTALPPLEEIREANTMRIIVVDSNDFAKEVLKTSMFSVGHDDEREPLYATVVKITDERVKGFMPSKVWWDDATEQFQLLYYVNPSLPKATKPFKDNTYMMYVYVDNCPELEYDLSMRLFIDQVNTVYGMMHVIMFGDETRDLLIIDDEKEEDEE